ncbi:MAG: acyl-CoA dehydrogenase family protein [Myxococcales bacterium]|nr:acyl-CoA dehydrogenase [Myxococcales bacterium]HIK84331.1 acyl-CoA dehydrogenase [Myxococcales bacterium]
MDFGLSEDQLLLEKTVRQFLSDQIPIERVRELRDLECPNDPSLWKSLAELGVTGIMIAEKLGGSGLALLDAALVSEALGHAVTPTAFLGTSVIAPIALAAFDDAMSESWLSGVATGDLRIGVAFMERISIREGAGIRLEGGRLHGKSMMAMDACSADLLLVAVDDDTLVIVDRNAQGVEVNRLKTTDATRCHSEILFEGAEGLAVAKNAGSAISRSLDAGRIVLAADVLGACDSMIDQSVRYAGQRKQFDRLIGSFQAVKHMCSEMIAELEPARSMLWYAAHSFDAMPEEAPLLSTLVLSHLSEIGREIASVATQVHGGIGWTDEQNLHFWFKRIGVARHSLGGPESLRERAAELQGFDISV